MFATIVLAVLALITVAATITAVLSHTIRGPSVLTAVGAGIVTLIVGALLCTTVVSTRNIGIVTTFGRPNGELSNGFHVVAPWQDVTEMDGAIQLQQFTGRSFDDHGDAVQVRLGNNSTAFVNVNINWRIDPGAAPQLFLDYRSFDNIRANLVDKQLQVAASHEFATFNPQQQTQGADLPGIAAHIKGDVQTAVGDRIEIQQVFVPGIFYDGPTQDRINQFNIEAQNTKVAEQAVATAQQRKAANDLIAQSVTNDPLVIVAQCVNQSLEKNQPPNGCWPLITNGTPLINLPLPAAPK